MTDDELNNGPMSYRQVHEGAVVNKKRKRKKRRRVILFLFLVGVGVLGYFGADIYFRLTSVFNQIYNPIGAHVPNLRGDALDLGEDPFSILILGLDDGRSDSMMVATVNPTLDTTYLLSIPRDTMVEISGRGTTRINHAFAYGGADLAIETVQNFLNIPIDYHVSLYMGEFHTLIDAMGGVRVVNNGVAFSLGGYDFPLGELNLTGSMAYYYVRMRMEDPRGDFGRQERQRDVLNALVGELAGVSTVTRYQDLLDVVGDSMQTNVSLNEMVTMSLGYNRALRNITNLSFNASGSIINGMYLIPIPEDQRLDMSNRLRQHLELN